jgi:hypothetical protein
MQDSTRTKIIVALAVFVIAGVSVWWYFGFSLEFMKFFAAEPEITQPSSESQADTTVSMVQCAPLTQTVSVGGTATLTGSGGAGLYAWYAPQGSPPVQETGAAAFSVSYATPGIKKVTVQGARLVNGQNDPAKSIVDNTACTVIVSP